MPRGYYKEDGEFVETKGIANNTFEYISPRAKPRAWRCRIQKKRMRLDPLNRDLPAESWFCSDCDRKVTLDQRDDTCLKEVERLKQKVNLKEMQYNTQSETWHIVSNDWSSPDGTRQTAKRKELTAEQREAITQELRDSLFQVLRIEFSDWRKFFQDQ